MDPWTWYDIHNNEAHDRQARLSRHQPTAPASADEAASDLRHSWWDRTRHALRRHRTLAS